MPTPCESCPVRFAVTRFSATRLASRASLPPAATIASTQRDRACGVKLFMAADGQRDSGSGSLCLLGGSSFREPSLQCPARPSTGHREKTMKPTAALLAAALLLRAARAGRAVSDQADPRHRAVRAGRNFGHPRARARAGTHAGLEPAGHRREPHRRQRQRRRGLRGQVGARRLYAVPLRHGRAHRSIRASTPTRRSTRSRTSRRS